MFLLTKIWNNYLIKKTKFSLVLIYAIHIRPIELNAVSVVTFCGFNFVFCNILHKHTNYDAYTKWWTAVKSEFDHKWWPQGNQLFQTRPPLFLRRKPNHNANFSAGTPAKASPKNHCYYPLSTQVYSIPYRHLWI